MPENVFYILLGLGSAAIISILMFIARKLLWNEVFEVKARRMDLFDGNTIRVAISFANQTRQSYRIKDLSLCYVLDRVYHPYGEIRVDPFVEKGAEGDNFRKDEDGTFSVPVSAHSRLDTIYTFVLPEEKIPENAKTMLSYVDEAGKRHYAEFSLTTRYGQLLTFKKRSYKEP